MRLLNPQEAIRSVQPLRLEHEYRERLAPGMFDLSASAPAALSAKDVLAAAGMPITALLDAPLDYERGGGNAELRAGIAALRRRDRRGPGGVRRCVRGPGEILLLNQVSPSERGGAAPHRPRVGRRRAPDGNALA